MHFDYRKTGVKPGIKSIEIPVTRLTTIQSGYIKT